MKTKLLLLLTLVLAATSAALGQTGAATQPAKTKIAVIDVMAFREGIGELKVKYDKLQTEFAPRYRELESMQNSLAAKEKVLNENQNLTQQQGLKLQQELEEGKRAYQRLVEDSQAVAAKREEEETGPIKEKLGKFLEQYCQKLNIAFVFDGRQLQETGVVIFADGKANITEDFIKEYNKAYPAPAPAAAPPKP
ncbi:MAG: OmpH family outer membrane protein [Acidobacteria bacterium]|nr:OmpH family outer membrane protein [Acidobacteriota bacterium]